MTTIYNYNDFYIQNNDIDNMYIKDKIFYNFYTYTTKINLIESNGKDFF